MKTRLGHVDGSTMSRFGVAVVTTSAGPLGNRSRPLYYPLEEMASECQLRLKDVFRAANDTFLMLLLVVLFTGLLLRLSEPPARRWATMSGFKVALNGH